MFRKILIVSCVTSLSACSFLERRLENRQFADSSAREEAEKDWAYASQLTSSRRLSSVEALRLEKQVRVKRLEKDLSGIEEKMQYAKMKPLFQTDDERMEFLSLGDVHSREKWARLKGLYDGQASRTREFNKLIENEDIALGMSRDAVRMSWGDPALLEVSGHEMLGNERWIYKDQTSSPDGFVEKVRTVIFQGGRVVGWKSQ